LSANARQIRLTAVCDIPVAAAIDRVDQCVASDGLDSSVFTITASTCSTVIVRGAPGRGSSVNPASRCARNRVRHLPTVMRSTANCSATCRFVAPVAHANTIFDRNANACADFGRRAHRCSVSRSSTDSVNSAFGRPAAPATRQVHNLMTDF
jgi:hypothetical protein